MSEEITSSLARLFETCRIVFWYDEKQELREEFEGLHLSGVSKLELGPAPFSLKYRLLRGEPKTKFLLYNEGPPPPDRENWLLDVELAHTRFRADQAALWAREVGLKLEDLPLVSEHAEFFRAARRRGEFKARLQAGDSHSTMRMHMLAVCAGLRREFAALEFVLFRLLEEHAREENSRYTLLERGNLTGFLWQQVARTYGYRADRPTIPDFVLAAFKGAYALQLEEESPLGREILLFFNHWQNDPVYAQSFQDLAARAQEDLGMEEDIRRKDPIDCLPVTLFRVVEQHLIRHLITGVVQRTRSARECRELIRERQHSPWYDDHQAYYQAVSAGAHFLDALAGMDLTTHSISDAVTKYAATWHRLDRHYRHFILFYQSVRRREVLKSLFDLVENRYLNDFLRPLNDRFQEMLDRQDRWHIPGHPAQAEFFDRFVRPLISDGKKVAVVISDALRYEIACELAERIGQEDRYDAEPSAMLSSLPSMTQLGMAALLPHTSLALQPDGTVWVDEQSATGTENRGKILQRAASAIALQANRFLNLTRDEQRSIFRDHQVLYLYHNQIDQIGDKRDSEGQVFHAVRQTLDELVGITKKLAGANYTHILVTSDHGFLYQHRPLEDNDFTGDDIRGAEITLRHRRFVLGRGLASSPAARLFTPEQAGLSGDVDIMVVKSINRLRQQGTGSRYVHGGASLQEVVIPMLQIRKTRESDISQVELDLLNLPSGITTGQLAVVVYQTEPATPKRQPRSLRFGIYAPDGTLISNQETRTFDSPSEEAGDRETRLVFLLSQQADAYNNQEVLLKMEEPIPETTQFRPYKARRLTLRKALSSDFDF